MLLGGRKLQKLEIEDDIGRIPPKEIDINVFSKNDYLCTLSSIRKKFVHEHFSTIIFDIFQNLRDMADKGKVCHYQATFNIAEHFDIAKTENILKSYFTDLGYQVFTERVDEEEHKIILTIT